MINSQEVITSIMAARYNPTAIQKVIYDAVESASNGEVRLVDPTNPVAFTIEGGAQMAAASMAHTKSLVSKLYPQMAQEWTDLYNHMSDADYLGRFSTPGMGRGFKLFFRLEDIHLRAIAVANDVVKRVTIPRHTEIMVADTKFTLQYPINIDVLTHGGLLIYYKTDTLSPIQTLATNKVKWMVTRLSNVDFLVIELDVLQMAIQKTVATLDNTSGFKKTFSYTDQFYHLRAYIKDTNGMWNEIHTTHSELVYDPMQPTVVLTLVEGGVQVVMPQVYFNNGFVTDSIRFDIYTTKGDLEMAMDRYTPVSYTVSWKDLDEIVEDAIYTAPLDSIDVTCYSNQGLSGGSDAMTFEQVRERIIDNSTGEQKNPISEIQLKNMLTDMGYDLVTDRDTVTRRVFLATRTLPNPPLAWSFTPANCSINVLQAKIAELIGLDTTSWDGDSRLVIKPNTLFEIDNGVVTVVPNATYNAILAMTPEARVAHLNNKTYLYTPFYYVLDISDNQFAVRPYDMSNPEVVARRFVEHNSTLGVAVSSRVATISQTENGDGYYLTVTTNSDDNFKLLDFGAGQVQMLLSYVIPGTEVRATVVGEHLGVNVEEEHVYRFHLESDFVMKKNHNLIMKSFTTVDDVAVNTECPLDVQFDLIIAVKNHQPANSLGAEMDLLIPPYTMDGALVYHGFTHEKIDVKLGTYLKHLWSRARSVVGSLEYQKYASNVYEYYTDDVLERDLAGNPIVTYDALLPAPHIGYNVLFIKDEPVLLAATENLTIGATIVNDTDLIFTGGTFTGLDVGKTFVLYGAGDAGAPLVGKITVVTDADNITIDVPVETATDAAAVFRYGNHKVLHAIGDTILDVDGEPIPVGGVASRGIVRQADMLFVDGNYLFVTDAATVGYRSTIAKALTLWITTDIPEAAGKLLERSEIFFAPKTTQGTITGIVGEGVSKKISAAQSFTVDFYMTADNYNNAELRNTLERTAIRVIHATLERSTIATADMEATLKAQVGDVIISCDINGLNGDGTTTMTISNKSAKPSVAKKIMLLADQTITVGDGVTFRYIKHRD